jgi:hypothetical protein
MQWPIMKYEANSTNKSVQLANMYAAELVYSLAILKNGVNTGNRKKRSLILTLKLTFNCNNLKIT